MNEDPYAWIKRNISLYLKQIKLKPKAVEELMMQFLRLNLEKYMREIEKILWATVLQRKKKSNHAPG